MRYPARFKAAPEGGFVVTFRDIPEAITQGDSEEETMEMAVDALVTAMDFYFEDHRPVPLPSTPRRGERLVELPPSVVAKVLLLNEMLAQHVSNAQLANLVGFTRQEINRVTDLRHSTKIDTIAKALNSLGRHLRLEVS